MPIHRLYKDCMMWNCVNESHFLIKYCIRYAIELRFELIYNVLQLRHPAQLDPKIPPGAPLFLEGLSRPHPLVLEGFQLS